MLLHKHYLYHAQLLINIHVSPPSSILFFFNDTATTEIYTLSLHDALPISITKRSTFLRHSKTRRGWLKASTCLAQHMGDRKSTRLNSSHMSISYAVFCLKKKKKKKYQHITTMHKI